MPHQWTEVGGEGRGGVGGKLRVGGGGVLSTPTKALLKLVGGLTWVSVSRLMS
jgi:hypothetical protein